MTAGGAISSGYGAGELPSAAVGRGESWLGRLFCRSSFTPGTQVLMADGSKKNIEDLRVGDKVLATDPKTGKTKAEPILGTITSKGDKTLVQISIATKAPALAWMADSGVNPSPLNLQGIGQSKSGMVIATNNHPFWVAGDINAWVMATDLKPGMWLRTSAGTYVQVTATKHWTARHQRVHNLTVANTHTFYVEAGNTPVLVHNDGGDDLVRVGRWMSQAEYDAMKSTGMVQRGGGGFTYVVYPASPDAYISARPGSVYAEFDVPRSSLIPGGRPGDFKMSDSTTINARLAAKRGLPLPELPEAKNLNLGGGSPC